MRKLDICELSGIDTLLDDYQQMIGQCRRNGHCYVEFDSRDAWEFIEKIRLKINDIIKGEK